MSPIPGSPCWKEPCPAGVPLSATTVKLTLAYCAQVWAALMIAFSQVVTDMVLPSTAYMSLYELPLDPEEINVPSGMKLRVISWGSGHAPPLRAYGTIRDSSCSRNGRARSSG